MSAVRPAPQQAPVFGDNPNVPHYGVFMGGAKELKIEGVGDAAVGHLSIPRRALAEFVKLQYGKRNESPESLNDDRTGQWYNNPERIGVKSPRQCALDVYATFGDRGFIIPTSLVGLDYDTAVALFDQVMPTGTLIDVIKALSSNTFEGLAEQLREELLSGAITARDYISRYSTEMASEVLNAPKTGHGKGGFDPLDIEYFRELNKPLPEELPALATVAMGKEIATAMQQAASPAPSVNEEILKALIEQNNLLREEAKNSRQAPTEKAEPVSPAKAKGTAGTKQE